MEINVENTKSNQQIIKKICSFFRLENMHLKSEDLIDNIKELCVARLCKSIGLTGKYNYKSDFFEFFSSIMGQAVCEVLQINVNIACDELRLIKYNHINLIQEVVQFLTTETQEEAFLDTFDLVDRFKYLIPQLKKV